jgi:hypothetical protein
MIKRVIDKQGNFIRDDFTFDEETEIGLDVEVSQGLHLPKWNGKEWVEGLTKKQIDLRKVEVVEEKSEIELLKDRVAYLESLIEKEVTK